MEEAYSESNYHLQWPVYQEKWSDDKVSQNFLRNLRSKAMFPLDKILSQYMHISKICTKLKVS